MARKNNYADSFAASALGESCRESMDNIALDALAQNCDTSPLESEGMGRAVRAALDDGTLSEETAEKMADLFGFTIPESADDFSGDEAVREYAAAVILSDAEASEFPAAEIEAFLDLIA